MGKEGEKRKFEQQLERALSARFQHFKDQADSLTLECVRRLIEKDLGLKEFSLDVHRKFIRKFLDKKFEDADEDEPSTENVDELNESSIKKAIWKRADHFLSNSENITLKDVRRLLEEDLGLEKNSLDIHKMFISQEIDQVLNSPKEAKVVKDVKKKASANVKAKNSKKSSNEEKCDSSHSALI